MNLRYPYDRFTTSQQVTLLVNLGEELAKRFAVQIDPSAINVVAQYEAIPVGECAVIGSG
jgi:hypothetical protein